MPTPLIQQLIDELNWHRRHKLTPGPSGSGTLVLVPVFEVEATVEFLRHRVGHAVGRLQERIDTLERDLATVTQNRNDLAAWERDVLVACDCRSEDVPDHIRTLTALSASRAAQIDDLLVALQRRDGPDGETRRT